LRQRTSPQHTKLHFDRFNRFGRAHARDQQTHAHTLTRRQTTRATSVTVCRPQWQFHAGAPKFVARPPNLASPQIVARPPNLAVLLTHCGQLIRGKIVHLMPRDARF